MRRKDGRQGFRLLGAPNAFSSGRNFTFWLGGSLGEPQEPVGNSERARERACEGSNNADRAEKHGKVGALRELAGNPLESDFGCPLHRRCTSG
jgi:hypothetical protein